MLVFDSRQIGEKLFQVRKRLGWTQMEAGTAAGIAERTYADIERGNARAKVSTLLRICEAMHITPDAILTVDNPNEIQREEELLARLRECTPRQREAAFRLLETYLQSLE